MVWKSCIHPLLQLPSAKKLARILEQSSPDLQEDLISAVELGMADPSTADSTIFSIARTATSLYQSQQDRY